ncbi:hypothetical protein [Flammeovirga sp. OC4]|uniref:hypothetical protein n=1 Tax=Flammeovirga sp. OC4 TaxID=1382345 RepID=UPI0012E07497|nr:hypothetical protein [Flammeovirga sp. OC4]
MKKIITSIIFIFLCLDCYSQNDSSTHLRYLNQLLEYPFTTEKNIQGICFITPSNDFDSYQDSIILNDKDNNPIVRIAYDDSLGIVTTFKGKVFKSYDSSNPFSPWLWVDNPDYFRLSFECTDSTGTLYKVKLNENEFGWIKKTDTNFKKETIKEFILKWTMEPMHLDFNRVTNPLKKEPKSNSLVIENPKEDKYKIWKA